MDEITGNIDASQCLQICQNLQRIGLFEVIDQDGSQSASRLEWEQGFLLFDLDQNGFLVSSEWFNHHQSQLDLNNDLFISITEWTAGFDLITQQQGDMTPFQYDPTRCLIGTCQTDIFTIDTFWGICL